MRLLNIKTLKLETFYGSDTPDYAALSHTWGDEEVTFDDLRTDMLQEKKGWGKILGTMKEAKHLDCMYVWIDTCCIDKSSSAELSEAINSMFRWYQNAKFCFVYLEDVRAGSSGGQAEGGTEGGIEAVKPFHKSRWFERGWTLQELIAPTIVYFFDIAWTYMGNKLQLEKDITEKTGIDADVLREPHSLYTKSIARRMSWAAERETTRVEDIAYCLMGMFNVNMPLLYGEGEKAFIRLQEEIMKSNYDHSLFAWNYLFERKAFAAGYSAFRASSWSGTKLRDPIIATGLLAPHPVAFQGSSNIIPHRAKTEPYAVTNRGLRINLRICPNPAMKSGGLYSSSHLAVLQCSYWNYIGTAIAIPVIRLAVSSDSDPGVGGGYCRAIDDFVEIESLIVKGLFNQNVYFCASGPLFSADMPRPLHCCWIRDSENYLGLEFKEALYREHPKSWRNDLVCHAWNHRSKSMTWDRDWHGLQAAILFLTSKGSLLVVVLSFKNRLIGTEFGLHFSQPTMQGDLNKPGPRRILLENVLAKQQHLHFAAHNSEHRIEKMLEKQRVVVRLMREVVFDDESFVMDIS